MIKHVSFFICLLFLTSCTELQQVINQLPTSTAISNDEIGNGLRAALDKGISKQVSNLTKTDGFFKNELVKIALPAELQKVDKTMRTIGLGKLADEGLKVLNRAAEDAVAQATPIFVAAVKNMSFNDAKAILLGDNQAATSYLMDATKSELYAKFNPVIKSSFAKVGADKVWNSLITKYNTIPLTAEVNPDLTDYVTAQALQGVFTMIAVEEQEIRTKASSRTTTLLKKVFAIQD